MNESSNIALFAANDPNPKAVGPIMKGIMETDIPIVVDGQDDIEDYDQLLVFDNQAPKINTDQPVSWWMCDYREPQEVGEGYDNIENIFLCNRELLDEYAEYYDANTYYMPQPGLPQSWKIRDTKGRVTQPLVFIGNFTHKYHQNRHDILSRISKEYPILVVSGEGQTKDQAGIYRKTDFSLAISPQKLGYTSNRLYNILSAGGLCLTLKFPGIEDLFEHGKHLLWFETPEEAIELIDEYKGQKDACDTIRSTGQQLYEEKHTAEERIDNILSIMQGDEDNFRGWLNS